MSISKLLIVIEGAGGLFDFNATLPLMAIQFILLSVVLTFVFYKPISKVVDDRNLYIKENFEAAYEKLAKADALNDQYNEKLRVANFSARAFISDSEKEAKALVASEINKAGKKAIESIQSANKDAINKREIVLSKLSIEYALKKMNDSTIEDLLLLTREEILYSFFSMPRSYIRGHKLFKSFLYHDYAYDYGDNKLRKLLIKNFK
jgi:F-type H+-transporting ATPase subunit b